MEKIFYCVICEKFHFGKALNSKERFKECPHCQSALAIDVDCLKQDYDSMSDEEKQSFKHRVKENYTRERVYGVKNAYEKEAREKEMKDKGIVFDYDGYNGKHISVYSNRCVITTYSDSVLGGGTSGGEKTIFFKDIVGVRFKRSGVSYGYLYLETASSYNTSADNIFYFESSNSRYTDQDMEKMKFYIIGKVSQFKKMPQKEDDSVKQLSTVAELFEKGMLTKEEFETIKKRIIEG